MESTRTVVSSLYSINYDALDLHTEETRANLIRKGFDAESLSGQDIRTLSLADYVAGDALLRLQEEEPDMGADATKTVGVSHLLSMRLTDTVNELAMKCLSLYRDTYTSRQIDLMYISLHDPMEAEMTKSDNIIEEKIRQAIRDWKASALSDVIPK